MPMRLRARAWRKDASCSFDAAKAFLSLDRKEFEDFLYKDNDLAQKLFYLSLPHDAELGRFLDFSLAHPDQEGFHVDFCHTDAAALLRATCDRRFAVHWLKACNDRPVKHPGAWHSWIIEESGMRAKMREMGGYMIPVCFLDGDPRRLEDIMRRHAIPGEMSLIDKKGKTWLVTAQGYAPQKEKPVKMKMHI